MGLLCSRLKMPPHIFVVHCDYGSGFNQKDEMLYAARLCILYRHIISGLFRNPKLGGGFNWFVYFHPYDLKEDFQFDDYLFRWVGKQNHQPENWADVFLLPSLQGSLGCESNVPNKTKKRAWKNGKNSRCVSCLWNGFGGNALKLSISKLTLFWCR